MFRNTRVMTPGIAEEVDPVFQQFLWDIIDTRIENKEDVHYMQTFDLYQSKLQGIQFMVHKEGDGEYRKEYHLQVDKPVNDVTIWVIDDGHVSTMLFMHEY